MKRWYPGRADHEAHLGLRRPYRYPPFRSSSRTPSARENSRVPRTSLPDIPPPHNGQMRAQDRDRERSSSR